MRTSPYVATAAELLFALQEPALAEQLIVDRCGELDGRNYVLLTALVKTAKATGRILAATLIWRALIDAILTRGYAKAYGHAARYLLEIRTVSGNLLGRLCVLRGVAQKYRVRCLSHCGTALTPEVFSLPPWAAA